LTHILVEQLYVIKKKVLKRFKYEGKWITPYRDIWPSNILPDDLSYFPSNISNKALKDVVKPRTRKWKEKLLEKDPINTL
ncbi:MAG: hypothetical protein ACFFCS_21535, partial [Candidatus Hodarchaeota archaeon]